MPAEVGFATKPALARVMMGRALDAGVPARWATADEAYGQDHKFRVFCEQRRLGYVVAVPRSQSRPGDRVWQHRVAGRCPGRRRSGAGVETPVRRGRRQRPRLHDWAMATLPDAGEGFERWLLIRRSITDPGDLAYYLCFGPAGTTIDQLVRIAGSRWAIEECFQSAKNETGLDHYQVRRYDAWHRHITLAMLAPGYLAVTAATSPKSTRGLVPLTPAEIRRLLAHLTSAAARPLGHALAWSHHRRAHQARARSSHYWRRWLIYNKMLL